MRGSVCRVGRSSEMGNGWQEIVWGVECQTVASNIGSVPQHTTGSPEERKEDDSGTSG